MKKLLCVFLMLPFLVLAADEEEISLFDLDATWRNQRDEAVTWAGLAGRPMILCMFFSHCGYACPRITADMQAIAEQLGTETACRVHFVMASFDAERDTPAMLATFAESKGIDAAWHLLHGDEATVRELAAALGIRYRREPDGNIAHSNLIILLDAGGQVAYRHEGLGGDLDPLVAAVHILFPEVTPPLNQGGGIPEPGIGSSRE
ncbi:MAG TPA: SCO family protein [Kiritimatiellia bacterium]|nr:SCO family protein [Kiritimatiellia bacterium]HMP35056.1 SCO family protein [Kiritimatiellia bacterium]